MKIWKQYPILRITEDRGSVCEDMLLREEEFLFFVNGEYRSSLVCSPTDLKELAVGTAYCQDRVRSYKEISSLTVKNGRIDISFAPAVTMANAQLQTAEDSYQLTLTTETVYSLWEDFDKACRAFECTGAAHAVGLSDANGLLFIKEDAGRHNALIKVLGAAVLAGIPTYDKILIFSGRMSGELLETTCASDVSILLCHGAATLLATEKAEALGVTLAGFVRRGSMNVYANSQRIIVRDK